MSIFLTFTNITPLGVFPYPLGHSLWSSLHANLGASFWSRDKVNFLEFQFKNISSVIYGYSQFEEMFKSVFKSVLEDRDYSTLLHAVLRYPHYSDSNRLVRSIPRYLVLVPRFFNKLEIRRSHDITWYEFVNPDRNNYSFFFNGSDCSFLFNAAFNCPSKFAKEFSTLVHEALNKDLNTAQTYLSEAKAEYTAVCKANKASASAPQDYSITGYIHDAFTLIRGFEQSHPVTFWSLVGIGTAYVGYKGGQWLWNKYGSPYFYPSHCNGAGEPKGGTLRLRRHLQKVQ